MLPNELTSKILREIDQSHVSRYLSKGMKEVSDIDFLQSSCRKPITKREMEEYFQKHSTLGFVEDLSGALSSAYERGETEYHFIFYIIQPFESQSIDLRFAVETKEELTENYGYQVKNDNWIFDLDNDYFFDKVDPIYDNIIYCDLLTIYKILLKRISCTNISQTFARDETINIFNEIILNWNKPVIIISLFMYLFMNMKVMNLPYYSDISCLRIEDTSLNKFYNNLDKNFHEQINDIPYMVNAIKNYLLTL